MKPIKLVSKNGVKSRCQKVVLSLFFANYFLAEKCRRFSKVINFIFYFIRLIIVTRFSHLRIAINITLSSLFLIGMWE